MCACKQTETYFLNVNGFETEVRYTEREIKGVLDVVLDTLVSIHEARDDGFRTVAFLSGPPGAGKSTLCLSMEKRASRRNIRFPVQ